MILYFSATGNSEHVARRIAAATSDKVMSIERFDAEILHLAVMEGPCRLGFVAPVYAWGLPTPMIEFLKTVDLSVAAGTKGGERPYTFYVSTYGSTTGQSAKFARDLLHERGLELDAAMSVKMPDTWTPVFDLSDPQKVEGINRAAEAQIDAVIEAVRARRTGNMMRHRVPLFASCAYHAIGLPRMQQTSKFAVDADRCIGCGLCAKRCPMAAIEMRDGLPVWTKPECAACLRCLHCCPKFAISHGKRTASHGQYRHPKPGVRMWRLLAALLPNCERGGAQYDEGETDDAVS